jgi:hypothetical protein
MQIPCTQGGKLKKLLCKERIKKNYRKKTKFAQITGGIYLFTLLLINNMLWNKMNGIIRAS